MYARKRGDAKALLTGTMAVALIAAGLIGCGGDEGDDAPANAPAAGADTAPRDSGAPADPVAERPSGTDEQQIRAVYRRFSRAMSATDAKAACAALTPNAQRLAAYDAKSCVDGMSRIYEAGRPGKHEPYIVTLEIRGDTADAMVKTKTSEKYPVDFAKHDGQWKINGNGAQSRQQAGGARIQQ